MHGVTSVCLYEGKVDRLGVTGVQGETPDMPVTGQDGASGGRQARPPATTYTAVKIRHVNTILLEEKTDKRCSEDDHSVLR